MKMIFHIALYVKEITLFYSGRSLITANYEINLLNYTRHITRDEYFTYKFEINVPHKSYSRNILIVEFLNISGDLNC